MRRSFKWILGLVPVVAGSVGTAIYLTSENSISRFNEVNTNRRNVQVETRISPLASSQDAKENTKTELLNSEKLDENVKAPKKIIVPEISEILPQKKENQKPNSAEKQTKTPIVIGKILQKSDENKKDKVVSNSKPKVIFFLPPKKPNPKPEQNKKKLELPKNQVAEKVVIAGTPEPKPNVPEVKKPELPTQAIIVDVPKAETIEPKASEQIQSPILGNEAVKPVETPPTSQPLVLAPQVEKDEEEKKKALQKQLDEQQKQREEKIKKEEEERKEKEKEKEKQRLEQERLRREEEERQRAEEERQAQEKKRQEEQRRQVQNSNPGSSSSGSSTSGVKGDQEIVNEFVAEISKNLNISNPQEWLDKYKLTQQQMTLFLEKLPTPKNQKEQSNLVTFWELSQARNYPDLVKGSGVREMWRDQIYKKLNLKLQGNGENTHLITQSGGRFGSWGFPWGSR
ncbi:Uncharacterised protein [Mesomycoplasma dispar]|uniref:Uncharacterized protein n=1 Tax=Mesomycoplasma dispar TaxID=86660 RepID=A0AAJ5NSG3_9BACT|nr:hypothetical protein [Mesomycoplasma dispar]AJR12222.1 hypothetical protein MDIS_02170 [Mesomycoplasma dispar]VEU61834.1 Uncharacterised protein [Mesomycoplasma dispar]